MVPHVRHVGRVYEVLCSYSVGGGSLLVMGGCDDGQRRLADVQVFDGHYCAIS